MRPKRPAGTRRRETITAALHRCIRKTGYHETSLTDIAAAAGMSPSHVLYYFDGKAAILAELFEDMGDQLRGAVLETEALGTQARIDALTELFFGTDGVTQDNLAVFLEIFGVAVRDERIRGIKCEWDAAVRTSFAALFAKAGASDEGEASEQALASLIGLATCAYFSHDRQFMRAKQLFRQTLERLSSGAFL
jgi:AcrR family transcriptional regulator